MHLTISDSIKQHIQPATAIAHDIVSRFPFRQSGLVIEKQGDYLFSNLQRLNAEIEGHRGSDISLIISRHTLNSFYWQLTDSLKSEYPRSEAMINQFAKDHVRYLLRRGGQVSYAVIQGWVHRYFYPVDCRGENTW